MNKKGQGLPLNTIIIAIIVIVVLVVLVMIFTGHLNLWSREITNCESQTGQVCRDQCLPGEAKALTSKCLGSDNKPIPGLVCCKEKTGIDIEEESNACSDSGGEWAESCDNYISNLGIVFDDYGNNQGKVCCKDLCSDIKDDNVCDDKGTPETIDDLTTTTQTVGGKFCCD